ncbi:MAG: RsmB/NOP family class I SAM-dependent RNA methyltransferase [Bdellovibrionota bacterium]
MKYHRLVIQKIVESLTDIFSGKRYADKVIEFHLKNEKKWGSRDRRFFAENVYDIVRHWRRLWNLAGLPDKNYLNPDWITEENIWLVWGTYIVTQNQPLPPWPEVRDVVTKVEIRKRLAFLTPAQELSWTNEMWEYAAEQGQIDGKKVSFEALNDVAPVFLRTNMLKTTPEKLVTALANDGIEAVVADKELGTIQLHHRQNVFLSQAFKNGLFEVQDISSQHVGTFLDPQPGERIVDACAGAGGKTLHIATLMKNKGKVLALDIHQWKLDALKVRSRRNGLDIIETRAIENSKTIKRLEASADRVLLDVPCSGSGVLRRNPDSKWKMSKEQIANLLKEQESILTDYCAMVKPGGVLVYSTCSFFVSENEQQVEAFLKTSQDWKLEKQIRVWPGEQGGDGFFMARLRRAAAPKS